MFLFIADDAGGRQLLEADEKWVLMSVWSRWLPFECIPIFPSGIEKCHEMRRSRRHSGSGLPLLWGRPWVFLFFFLSVAFAFVWLCFASKKKPDHHVLPLNRRINPLTNAIIKGGLGPGLTAAPNPNNKKKLVCWSSYWSGCLIFERFLSWAKSIYSLHPAAGRTKKKKAFCWRDIWVADGLFCGESVLNLLWERK